MSNQAERIIAKFGGLAKAARALNHRHASTVQGWMERGVIPVRRHAEVLAAAKAEGISLKPADFFDPPMGACS